MKERVTYLRMHGATHLPGIGNIEGVLGDNTKHKDLFMTYTPGEQVVNVKSKTLNVRIPLTNIQIFTTEPLAEETSAKSKKAV